jgi:hypothetical protein
MNDNVAIQEIKRIACSRCDRISCSRSNEALVECIEKWGVSDAESFDNDDLKDGDRNV